MKILGEPLCVLVSAGSRPVSFTEIKYTMLLGVFVAGAAPTAIFSMYMEWPGLPSAVLATLVGGALVGTVGMAAIEMAERNICLDEAGNVCRTC